MRASIAGPRPVSVPVSTWASAVVLAFFALLASTLFSLGSQRSTGGRGCHHPPPADPDAGPDAGPDDGGPNDGGPADAPNDAPIDAPVDGPPAVIPTITAVMTPYGGNDLRQGSVTIIVLTGEHLLGTTAVTIDGRPATVTGSTDTAVAGYYDTGHGHPLGAMTITAVTPHGTASLVGGVEVTPFVVSPTGDFGRGTFDQPTRLGDSSISDASGAGDTIFLLGGVHVHRDGLSLSGGQIIEGALDGSAIIRGEMFGGFGLFIMGGETATILRRLTIELPGDVAIYTQAPQTVVEDVTVVGGGVGIQLADGGLKLRRSTLSGQSVASVQLFGQAAADLGTAMDPGGNALAVTTGFALDDARTAPSMMTGLIQAAGTTLNGRSYAGQLLDGPASAAPDYRLASGAAAIQF
jgi:hypothetical protein